MLSFSHLTSTYCGFHVLVKRGFRRSIGSDLQLDFGSITAFIAYSATSCRLFDLTITVTIIVRVIITAIAVVIAIVGVGFGSDRF